MLTYVYDGSLEGLFTALYEGLFSGEEVAEITEDRRYTPTLFPLPRSLRPIRKKPGNYGGFYGSAFRGRPFRTSSTAISRSPGWKKQSFPI